MTKTSSILQTAQSHYANRGVVELNVLLSCTLNTQETIIIILLRSNVGMVMSDIYICYILKFIIPFGKFGTPYPGKATYLGVDVLGE